MNEEAAYRAAGSKEEWSVTSRRIALDAVRTEPTADFYVGRPANVQRLQRILHAYAKSDAGVGYCQVRVSVGAVASVLQVERVMRELGEAANHSMMSGFHCIFLGSRAEPLNGSGGSPS